jgi:hypothetical protein
MRKHLGPLSFLCLLTASTACTAAPRQMTRVEQYNQALRAANPNGVSLRIDTRYALKPDGQAPQIALGAGDRVGTHVREAYLAQKAGQNTAPTTSVVIHNDGRYD